MQEIIEPLRVPSTRPTDVELAECFPKRARVPSAALWRMLDATVAVAKALPAPSLGPAMAQFRARRREPAYDAPITRSRSGL